MNFSLVKTTVLVLFIACFIASCGEETTSETKTTKSQPVEKEAMKEHCFRIGGKDNPNEDMEELMIKTQNGNATGVYNIVPAEKDSRLGTLHGTIKDNVITANYIFEQEGQKDEMTLMITLKDKEVIVKGTSADYPMEATMPRVSCD